ncbi:MAG: LexA family transcriptional regulator [Geobacteraceae bacterium]|nr:LexA family transcriptional regulator [Geobacteraceae bacterium]
MSRENNHMEIARRIKEIRLSRGLTQQAFAKKLGIVQGFLSDVERGKKHPSDTLLIALCHLYEINEEWLFTGAGEISRRSIRQEEIDRIAASRTTLLKRVPPEFPEGITEDDIYDRISLPGVPEGCYALFFYGDFMAPTINDGDLVLFTACEEFSNGDIVLLNNLWGETILRRYRIRDNEVMLAPDNPLYRPFRLERRTRIFGRVLEVWRKIKF